MLLRRLVWWTGYHQVFHPAHFGFLPTRDSVPALATFFKAACDARTQRHFFAAVRLDIKAAYDTVWPDNLIYKLASMGICGRMGRWIAQFMAGRAAQVRWKAVLSSFTACSRGVPQGSVLSPFLFMAYMHDIFEVLEHGVNLIVYVDDLVVYATGPDELCARKHLQNTLQRLSEWCATNRLSISPDKCSAINFSRSRDPGQPMKYLGWEIPWSSVVQILGVWFSRSTSFLHHFTMLKMKAHRRINYLKFVSGRSWGIDSSNMLRIANATVRSLLEYGCPLFLDAPPSVTKILETIYNAALRVATGLPRWSPLPVLRREAGEVCVASRLSFLTRRFLLRQLASPADSLLGSALRSSSGTKWTGAVQDLTDSLQVSPSSVLQFVWPPPVLEGWHIITTGLAFQDPALPDSCILPAWLCWRASLAPGLLLATDASKTDSATSIAAVEDPSGLGVATLINHRNSVFTAEALAIRLALSSLVRSHGRVTILSDSLSVLAALGAWSFRSPRIILLLVSHLSSLTARGVEISLVWCPSHKGIPPNECADRLARQGPFRCDCLAWVSAEDLAAHLRKLWDVERHYEWLQSDYSPRFTHLLPDRPFPRWAPSRDADVLLARWRSRTLVTHQKLYRMNLSFSPLCRHCFDLDTPEHILLHCHSLTRPRQTLLRDLRVHPPLSYHKIMLAVFDSQKGVSALLRFSKAAGLLD